MANAEKKLTKGRFITFEGMDGAGKTTQMRLAGEYLRSLGFHVVSTREPGGTPLAEKLRALVKDLDPAEELSPLAELLMIEAARAQHVDMVIRPALERGDWVLCDRFTDSTTAYQGYGRGISLEEVAKLNAMAVRECVPDRTILLTVRSGLDSERVAERGEVRRSPRRDRFDGEEDAFKRAVREGFAAIAAAGPERVRIVDCSGTVAQSCEKVRKVLDELV